MIQKVVYFIFSFFLILVSVSCTSKGAPETTTKNIKKKSPNVIVIMVDDLGYGDVQAHGNTNIKTPAIDQLYYNSVRLTNYHVSPTCSPTRAAFLTGKHSNRTGVWHTVNGRSLLQKNERTMASVFKKNGYITGIFGKWHLGDNYPSRPQDQGFDEVLTHGGGGVGQSPDYFDNDYFDDTYIHNGNRKPYKGYCTDVWFDNAIDFITTNQDRPFFCYIAPNAAHSPYFVEDKYAQPYRDNENIPNANFYGMISNIDDNLGKLVAKLKANNLMDNTIVVFTTDNGTAAGAKTEGHRLDGFIAKGYNAGMRGVKASMYEGGHRVPLYIYWKEGKINTAKDIKALTSHFDILPTLIDLCGLEVDKSQQFDGSSLLPLIEDATTTAFDERVVITNSQRNENPEKWRRSAIMQGQWRLINGQELYNLDTDPEQRTDVSTQFPEKKHELKKAYDQWWEEIKPSYQILPRITVGSVDETPVVLSCHDWHTPKVSPWNQGFIRKGYIDNGHWMLTINEAGKYRFQLRRWPIEINQPLNADLPPRPMLEGTSVTASKKGKALPIIEAGMNIQNTSLQTKVSGDDTFVEFVADLEDGEANLNTWFLLDTGQKLGAYYVYVEKL